MAENKSVNEVRVPIQETFILPSHGIPYNGEVAEEVTLRAMTTMDEKARLSGSGLTSLVNLINSCVVSPEGFDARKLRLYDLQYLMYMLRVITYGSNYDVDAYCQNCERVVGTTIDIDTLEITQMEDTYTEPFSIGPLPVSGDILECQTLSIGDLINIDKEAKRILAKHKDYVGDPEFILGYKYIIAKVNGEELPDFKRQQYVENMNAQDLMYFDSIYGQLAGDCGLNTTVTIDCPQCGAPVTFTLPINEEFFRPKYSL